MTRRPDERTLRQRVSSTAADTAAQRLANLHLAVKAVRELNGSTSAEIRQVMLEDIRRGSRASA